MANLRKDRVPGPTLSHPSAPPAEASAGNGHAAPVGSIAFSLRLRTSDSAGTGAGVTWRDETPAIALALDVVTASGGAPDFSPLPHLTARFFDLQNALLAARRFHWALQGLSENSGAPMAASIAIHAAGDGLSASATSALENAAPGQVLLSHAFAQTVHQVPGFTLRPSSDDWQSLSWSSPADPQSFSADENAVLALIRLRGREDPLANIPAPPPAPVAAPYQPPPASLGRSVVEPDEAPQPIWKKPLLLVGVGVVVLAVAAVFIMRAISPGTTPQVPPPNAGVTTPSPAPPDKPNVPIAQDNPSPARPQPAKPSPKTPKVPKTETPVTPKTENPVDTSKTPQPTAACSLSEADIALSLQRAARMMSDGRLTEAQDAYQRLVGCPTAREKATEGLRLVKQRMNFEGIPN